MSFVLVLVISYSFVRIEAHCSNSSLVLTVIFMTKHIYCLPYRFGVLFVGLCFFFLLYFCSYHSAEEQQRMAQRMVS